MDDQRVKEFCTLLRISKGSADVVKSALAQVAKEEADESHK